MKKRYSIIFTLTAAAVLVSSVAYASKKKLKAKSEPRTPDVSEVDLATNLLDSSAGYRQNPPSKADYTRMRDDVELKDLTMADKSKFPGKPISR